MSTTPEETEALPVPARDKAPDYVAPGRRCIWRHKPRGGYGYVIRIPVTVAAVHASRVTVRLDDGQQVIVVWVSLVDGTQHERRGEASVEQLAEHIEDRRARR